MKLKVWAPSEVVLDVEVSKVKAEAPAGGLSSPRHVDFVSALVPGILSFGLIGGTTEYLAIDHGVLVKCGAEVSVSTRTAVRSQDVATLRDAVENQFRKLRRRNRLRVFLRRSSKPNSCANSWKSRNMRDHEPPPDKKLPEQAQNLIGRVEVRAARILRARGGGGSPAWRAMALVGLIGWTVVFGC